MTLKSFIIVRLSLLTLILNLTGCGLNHPNLDTDLQGYVGTGIGASIKIIHSPQRKPKKIRNLQIGAPLSECLPNLPEPLVIDPEETFEKYSNLGDGFDQARSDLMKHANPLTEARFFQRWGERKFESSLAENSAQGLPIFDVMTINHGAGFEGRGLYFDLSAIGSLGYSIFLFLNPALGSKPDLNLDLPMLITLTVPKGTLYLDLKKRNFLSNSKFYKEFVKDDYDSKKTHIPAPLLIHYESKPHSIPLTRDPNGPPLSTPIGSNWHVLKTNEKVEAKEFDGQEISTEDLLEYERVMRKVVFGKVIGDKPLPHSEKVYDYYQSQVTPIFSKRTFKPNIQEKIPYPLTALYPAKIWGHFDEMKHCIGAKIPHILQDPIYSYWRFDGTCGGYADREATLLVIDPPSKREDPKYQALEDKDNQACLKEFPAIAQWIEDDDLKGLRCLDVIPIHKKHLSSTELKNSIHYIIIGRHSNIIDCGLQN